MTVRTGGRHTQAVQLLREAAKAAGATQIMTEPAAHTLLMNQHTAEDCLTMFPPWTSTTRPQNAIVDQIEEAQEALAASPDDNTTESLLKRLSELEQKLTSSLTTKQKEKKQALRCDLAFSIGEEEYWIDATVVGTTQATREREYEEAVQAIQSAIDEPTKPLPEKILITDRKADEKARKYALLRLIAARQRLLRIRKSKPKFCPIPVSSSGFLPKQTSDLFNSLSVAFYNKFRQEHGYTYLPMSTDPWGWTAARRTAEFRNRLTAKMTAIVVYNTAKMLNLAGLPWTRKKNPEDRAQAA
jgi:hypothetical protein